MTRPSAPGRDKVTPDPADQKPSTEQKPAAHDDNKRAEAEASKATQFDGNPNPDGAQRSALKPKDDTPLIMDKKSGPRTGRA